ncbi:hypothetical protein BDY19DRAFT_663790 [Irpex rosettiformis]|uniref:Uncharacterized protein n=1 Tax=Irpex rosettiformis TaxID=378272 RepID=A0ACB8U9A7_9APHY|nr:hypothetical protein BDY19DRAFT_663790 [Irpex rosettiformis]
MFKVSELADPFYSLAEARQHGSFEKTDFISIETLVQLARCGRDLFLYQHRTHVFVLFIAGNVARFIRLDRAGACVSSSFDYVQHPKPLAQFLWSYSNMSSAHRGWDTTVVEPSSDEVDDFHAAINDWITRHGGVEVLKQRFPGVESTLDEDYPTYKLTVEPEFGKRQELVIQRPFSQSCNLIGHSTRTYIAYSQTEKTVVFYKESWRVDAEKDTSEATAYRKLSEHNVPHTPTVFCAGDVYSVGGELVHTETNIWARKTEAEWFVQSSALEAHVLHRIVQRLYYPVQWLLSSRQFVTVMRDCTIASEKSSEIGLLHRDISIGNVMANFTDDGRTFIEGILNDWDHFGYVSSNNQVGSIHRNLKQGTWPFMSIEILKNPNALHSIMDEMQSIFWVLLYGTYRFFDNNADIIWDVFFDRKKKHVEGKEEFVGGNPKTFFFLQTDEFISHSRTNGITTRVLGDLVESMALHWQRYYYIQGWWPMHGEWRPLHGGSAYHGLSDAVRAVASFPLKGLRDGWTNEEIDRLPAVLEDIKEKLSKPQFWITIFDRFLNDETLGVWPGSDAVPDKLPPQDEVEATNIMAVLEEQVWEGEIVSIDMGESYDHSESLSADSDYGDSGLSTASAPARKKHARDDDDLEDGDINTSGPSSRFRKRQRIASPASSSGDPL